MVLEEFYKVIYLDIFYRYIQLKEQQYIKDNIQYTVIDDAPQQRCITFDSENARGSIILWDNGIIEEIITRKKDDTLLFYLHYEMTTLAQCHNLFEEFYAALLQQSTTAPIKILLCCTGGLTTSFFTEKVRQLIALENLNIVVDSIAFHQLPKCCQLYDCIYLAPQVAYLLPKARDLLQHNIPIYHIEPSIYATYNSRQLLHSFLENSKATTLC